MQLKKVIGWALAVLAAASIAVAAVLFLPKAESTAPAPIASSSANPGEEESVDPEIQKSKDDFSEQVKKFEVTLRSRNCQEAESARHERLATFMLSDALALVTEIDRETADIRDRMCANKTTITATVSDAPVADLGEDLVEAETEVTVLTTWIDDGKTATHTDTFTSTTTWVRVEGAWMASDVDPYE